MTTRTSWTSSATAASPACADPSSRSALPDQPYRGPAVAGGIDVSLQSRAKAVEVAAADKAGPPHPTTPFSPPHGEAMHQDLQLLVDAGLSPIEALPAATVRPAEVFGRTDRGVIAAGRRADLLLVNGDPTTDISTTRNIAGVWVAGERVR